MMFEHVFPYAFLEKNCFKKMKASTHFFVPSFHIYVLKLLLVWQKYAGFYAFAYGPS